MDAESCRRRQPSYDVTLPHNDVTTRLHDDEDEDAVDDYSGHLAVAMPTPAITHQSAAREPGRRGTWQDDLNSSGLWSQPNRKSMKPEMANSARDLALERLSMCVLSTPLIVSARLRVGTVCWMEDINGLKKWVALTSQFWGIPKCQLCPNFPLSKIINYIIYVHQLFT